MDLRAWLLDGSDPAVRALALERIDGRAPIDPDVAAARAASVTQGSVARVLAPLSAARDAEALWSPKYDAPYHRLVVLAEMGAPPHSRILGALDACLDAFARPDGGFGRRGESHLCITGNLVRAALAFGRGADPRVQSALAWLVQAQREDGGWHCFPEDEPGGTVDAWEPLDAFARVPPAERSAAMRDAIRRGVAFLLDQRLGVGQGYGPWEAVHFPRHYYYDALLGLELATALGDPRDARLAPALAWLRAKRRADGAWALDATHPDVDPAGDPPYQPILARFLAEVERVEVEPPGVPSRWATLAAFTVLRRAEKED